ncbi:MAG: sodium ion-translocating decarboxylase subunit beta [Oscillospiraceae bacterium]|nr:sodium ion-translocating decarboxylase subunit beta [Candidatus Equicaccousia limihippi]
MGCITNIFNTIGGILSGSGFAAFFEGEGWKNLVMIGIACFLMFLAIKKGFEPLLLLPIAFGMLLANLPNAGMFHADIWQTFLSDGVTLNAQYWSGNAAEGYHIIVGQVLSHGGLLDILYLGVKLGIYPPLIFLGIGAMTDFSPLISRPSSFLMGAAAQMGIFIAFIGALVLGMTPAQAGSIGIIGGADGPTAIFVTSKLAPELLGPIAVAAYSYMALVPVIQPPIMRALTTKKERLIRMETPRTVSKTEKIIFPILITIVVALILPDAAPLVGMLMFGNLLKESGQTDRLAKAAQNELMNIVTIFLGTTVGATTSGTTFLNFNTIKIVAMGLVAFCFGTAGGVLLGKLMCFITKGKINPLIGSAGVSAVPMAARVSQKVGQEEDPGNFLLMNAMGPNVAGVIGSAVAAGVLINMLG